METAASSDKAIGLGAAFGVLGLLSALTLFVAGSGHNQLLAGVAFGGAILAGCIAITAFHIYD